MIRKYSPKPSQSKNRRATNPAKWIMGPDELTREKYYAWLKHRCQARYRKEEYHLEWADWQNLWSDELFLNRGRGANNVSLSRIDLNEPWTVDNCTIDVKTVYLKRNKEYRVDKPEQQ